MRYDPNYDNQFFWDRSNRPGLLDLANMVKTNIGGTNSPRDKRSRKISVDLAVGAIAVAVTCVIIYATSRSALFTLVIGVVAVFYAMGIGMLVELLLSRTIYSRNYTETVSAKCIGISIHGETENGQLIKTPVFEYSFGGRNYIAFDGKWSNFRDNFPEIGGDWEIELDPDNPEDIRWQPDKSFSKFAAIWGIAAILFASMVLWSTLHDEDFMAACNIDAEMRIETSAER